MARLLLEVGVKLTLLFAAASAAPACIIPIGPEFQDPPGAPDAAPEILNPNPMLGATVSATSSQTFSFTVTDPNGGDTLYLRWVSDFPPFSAITSRTIPVKTNTISPTGGPQQTPISETIICNQVFTGFSQHLLIAAVADRVWDDGVPNELLLVDPPGKVTMIAWTLNLTCPSSSP